MLTLLPPLPVSPETGVASPKTPHPDYLAYLRRGVLLWIAYEAEFRAENRATFEDVIGRDRAVAGAPILAELRAERMTPRRARAELDGVRLTLVGGAA